MRTTLHARADGTNDYRTVVLDNESPGSVMPPENDEVVLEILDDQGESLARVLVSRYELEGAAIAHAPR